MRKNHVSLDGKGYKLVTSRSGTLASGTLLTHSVDPFANRITEDKYEVAHFEFKEGAGARWFEAGMQQYRWGGCIDGRDGELKLGPSFLHTTQGQIIERFVVDPSDVLDVELSTGAGAFEGRAERVRQTTGAPVAVRSFGLLVRRDPAADYSAAGAFRVSLQSDAGGGDRPSGVPLPGGIAPANAATVNISLQLLLPQWLPFEDTWSNGEYFWITGSFPEWVQIASGVDYWLCVENNQAVPLYWGRDNAGTATYWFSNWDTATWSAEAQGKPFFFKLKLYTDLDRETLDMVDFRGSAGVQRLMLAVGPKVMYHDYHVPPATWPSFNNSKGDFPYTVLDLCVYGGLLWAAVANGEAHWIYDGASTTTNWKEAKTATKWAANCFCVHDDAIWRASGNVVQGADDFAYNPAADPAWDIIWGTRFCNVGDPQTPITALSSHDGQLYALKPEGLFVITYPDGYPHEPTSTDPEAIMVLDFRTEVNCRPFGVDWHSGLYFSGMGGLYQYRQSLLTDVWSQGVQSLAAWYPGTGGTPIKPMFFQAACGTTKGLALAAYCRNLGMQGLWWYDGSAFQPIWTLPNYGEIMSAVHVSSLGGGKGHMYVGMGFDVYRALWPTWTEDPRQDPGSRYAWRHSAFVLLPEFDNKRLWESKDWLALRFVTKDCDAVHNFLRADYSLNGGTTWYTCVDPATGAARNIDTSPVQTVGFSAGSVSPTLMLMITFGQHDDAEPSETQSITSIDLLFQSLPETVLTHQVVIDCRTGVEVLTGQTESKTAQQIHDELLALCDRNEPIAYVDEYEHTVYVRVLNVSLDTKSLEIAPSAHGPDVVQTAIVTMMYMGDYGLLAPVAPPSWGVTEWKPVTT